MIPSISDLLPGRSGLVFTCKIGRLPENTFQVTEFTLNEEISSLFTLSVSVVSLLPSVRFKEYLGMAASLTVTRNGTRIRTVQGLLVSAEQGNTDGNKTWYHFIIRPEMWIMTLNQDSRIFRQQSVPGILAILLKEAHVKNDLKFYQDELHQKREYITQKRESAYEFWCRLAFEEGINFWFEDGPKLFYSDNHLGMTAGIHLTYNPQADTDITDSTAFSWRYAEQLCGDIQIHKDYNPQRPSYPLQHQVIGEVHQQHSTFESYGRFQQDAPGKPFTQLRYEQSRNQSQTGSAGTNCFALRPGKVFSLKNHPSADMNTAWQVISVSHRGVQPQADNSGGEGTTFSNTVQFIPGTQEWRPPFRYKPTADGDELATVVGPPGEEIYTNEQGAVKVYFHWDRYGRPDHSASCWLRVAHGWNGDGFGFMSIPRIGQEVIVSYLNGDIDRPIITGCTYNGRNSPPLNLPSEQTRTTFRTKTHKGEGFNELRFEDLAGKEEVYIHAQKDMNTRVLHDRLTEVDNDHEERIGQHQKVSVTQDQTSEIGHNRTVSVKQDDELTIGGQSSLYVAGNITQTTDGQLTQKIGKSMYTEIADNHELHLGKNFLIRSIGGEIIIGNAGGQIVIDPMGNIRIEGLSVTVSDHAAGIKAAPALFEYSGRFRLTAEGTEEPLVNQPYRITTAGGQAVRGVTDANGFTMTLQTKQAESLTLTVPEESQPKTRKLYRMFDNSPEEYVMEFKDDNQ
ncbi:TPA: type VI secretion system tip protein VgrG [Morganella morganii]|nr:type VI secretion system tip protein VgrG [Morganella morganii]